eukprot:NODE_112_length_18534_cov_1.163656.p19 type:complete len:121 gc:universal NODE_112_length_18534_cov_1.163656:7683-8045(+)
MAIMNNLIKCKWAYCSFEAENLKSLYNHAKQQHLTDYLQVTCYWDNCNINAVCMARLKTHILTHIPYRAHKCETCPKSFKRLQELNRHIKVKHPDLLSPVSMSSRKSSYPPKMSVDFIIH